MAAASVAAVTPAVKRIAVLAKAVAEPKKDRWHTRPVPLLGGVAIAVGMMVALAASGRLPRSIIPADLVIAGMFLLGLVDDLVKLKPVSKLVGQIVVASRLPAVRRESRLDRLRDPEWRARDRVDRHHYQRCQSARQHGRLVRRHRSNRRRGMLVRVRRHIAGARGPVCRGLRGDGRLPLLQFPAGIDLHGRRGKPAARQRARGAGLVGQPPSGHGTRLGPGRPGMPAADPALRHRVRDAVAHSLDPLRVAGRPRSHVASAGGDGVLGNAGGAVPVGTRGGGRRCCRRQPFHRRLRHRSHRSPAHRRPHAARDLARARVGLRWRRFLAAHQPRLHAAARGCDLSPPAVRDSARRRPRDVRGTAPPT